MKKDLVEQMKENMKTEGIKNLAQLALHLDVPYDRMYKWSIGKAEPKRKDAEKINAWLNGKLEDYQNNLLKEPLVNYKKPKDGLEEERAMLQVLLLEVAKLKSKAYGVSIDDAIDELHQNTRLALKQMKSA